MPIWERLKILKMVKRNFNAYGTAHPLKGSVFNRPKGFSIEVDLIPLYYINREKFFMECQELFIASMS
jgi:hypothetical protein